MADSFEVSEITVARWANGTSNPHPTLQAMVVRHIRDRAELLDSAEHAHAAWADNPTERRTAPEMMADWFDAMKSRV